MGYDAMLVIDMQTALVDAHPYNEAAVLQTIRMLCEACRESHVPVIYVRQGDELERNSAGWEIAAGVAPVAGEKVIDKQFNSAFRQTELHDYLQSIQAKNLILCGMQVEFCIDATVKVAFEHGYSVTIPKSAATTFDCAFASGKDLTEYYEEKIWNRRYADVAPAGEILKKLVG